MDDAIRAQFVDAHWATLVQRVGIAVMPIADELWSNEMLGSESYSKIKAAATNQEKMRVLFDVLHSGGNAVKSAFYSGLEKHEEFLLRDLSLNPTAECYLESLDEYKKWIQREYEFVTEYNSLPGEDVLLSERYIQPLIVMRHREKNERTQELCFKGEGFQQFISSENHAEKENNVLDTLFNADSKGICPAAVILQGNSGKGKSFTAQKIMLDWASGSLSRENFDCVFHLKCKELNQISEEQSLVEILSINSNLTPDQILQILQKSPKRVLVLIDGFDELKFSLRDASKKLIPNNLSEKAPPDASLIALLSGCILPESFLLVTSRSTTTDTLGALLKKPQRFTEIIGFSEREVEEYFQKFFQDEEKLIRNAYESVKANETLFTACSSPVICWIICTVIRERFNDGADVTNILETTTSIYVDFVFTLLEHHCQGLSESVPTLLKSLGQLAEKGVLERQVLFDEKSVKKAVSDPSGSPFLGKLLFKKRTRQETMFSFMHLSFQEFFTALYYVLDEKEFDCKLTKWFHSDLPEYHFFPVIQFLCGLCNKEVSGLLKETHNVSVPPSVQAQLKEWILHFRPTHYLRYILLCLYELHEKDFVQKAIESWQEMDMSWETLSRTDCWTLVYCLECCPHFRRLNLSFAAEELKMLQSVLCRTPELKLDVQNLADTDVSDLISALGEEKLLRALRLDSKGLSDHSVRQILHALHKQKTVGGLQIAVKNISADTVLLLTDFIQNTEKWDEISLWTNTDCTNPESLCSGLQLFNTDGIFALRVVRLCLTPQKAPSLSEIILRYPHSEKSSMNLKNFLQDFHDINCLTEESAGFDQQVNSLLSPFFSLSELTVIISAPLLTEKWASRIIFLIQSCSSSLLLCVIFKAGFPSSDGAKWLPGLLMEEGIRLLQEFPKHPRCTLVIEGLRCCKSTGCSHQTDKIQEIDCNQSVVIVISRANCTEDCSDQEST